MTISKFNITIITITLLTACTTKQKEQTAPVVQLPERICDCSKLYDKESPKGYYLNYYEGEDSGYTGKCKLKTDNGNEITYKYFEGFIVSIIERYPSGRLCEEMYYGITGNIRKRVQYYENGKISYLDFHGDHALEKFYENGNIEIKGMYGFRRKGVFTRDKDFYNNTLYDSIWKENGEFDSVRHYSEASITY